MAKHFSSIGKKYADKIDPSARGIMHYLDKIEKNQSSIFILPICRSKLERIIDDLPNKTSSGWDGLSNILVKKLKMSIITPLLLVINKSISEGICLDILKLAYLSPLHKSGGYNECTNFRPISLLAVISKIFEKVMYSQTYQFLQETKQLYQSQYGFRRRHSCENAIQELLSSVLKGRENNKYTAAIFLDLSKAFDTLEHSILIKKLELYGICGLASDWYISYLNGRNMSVKCSAGEYGIREISSNYPLEYGIPQGSCLGPLLFLIYCNNLPINLTLCSSILFADNTTLYKSHENLIYLKWCLQEELSILLDWFHANKFTLNLTKSVYREGAQRAGNFLPPFQIFKFFQESPTMLSIESVLTLLLIKQDSSL